ncbi:eukaryotic translation initiation factor 4E1-like isoform X2 [Hyposmocoma kahamanoa]|nr:eukaryotic translation initiation factor 4E1-like isoform X2 [Hyposmocoma kahamanoa]
MFTNDKKKWEDNLIELTAFNTVEDYWSLYHYMKTPSELSLGQDYCVFKKGIRPMWEDAANKKGGRWLITFEKRRDDLDWIWLDTVLLLIGENFENNDLICGVVVNVRAKCKISVWIKDASNPAVNMEIGKKLKAALGNVKIGFQLHDSNKNLYTV